MMTKVLLYMLATSSTLDQFKPDLPLSGRLCLGLGRFDIPQTNETLNAKPRHENHESIRKYSHNEAFFFDDSALERLSYVILDARAAGQLSIAMPDIDVLTHS